MKKETGFESEYDKLPDEALVELFRDSHGLIPAAKIALLHSMHKRNLPVSGTEEPGPGITEVEADQNAWIKLIAEIIQWKQEGFSNDMIVARLTHQGYSAEQIVRVAEQLKMTIHEKIAEADAARLGALIRLFCGAAVFLIAWLASLGNGVYFIGIMLAAVSVVQAAIADKQKSRFNFLLQDAALNNSSENQVP